MSFLTKYGSHGATPISKVEIERKRKTEKKGQKKEKRKTLSPLAKGK